MDTKDKKIQEALKHYDNKEYKEAKRSCDKILEKQPNNGDVLALKGLTLLSLNQKDEGKKLINEALKINMKNPVAWNFYAMYSKECKNYPQAIKCYSQSIKYDPSNLNCLRDLSFLQLFLRQYADFCDTARKTLDQRSNLPINWITSAFGYYLTGNYPAALSLTESCEKIGNETLKKQEKHELLLFKADILKKMNKKKESIELLIQNQSAICDKTLYHEKIIKTAMELDNKELGLEHCNKAFEINAENINYFIWYFNLKLGKEINVKEYNDLLSLQEDNKYISQLCNILITELKPKLTRSRIVTRLELAFTTGTAFKDSFIEYFNKNIKINIPSFFSNIKFIYSFQKYKLNIIDEILTIHLKSIKEANCLDKSLTNNEILNLNTHIIWVYFYAAQHYDYQGDLEKALQYINLAIDLTPSIVEFYMTKSRILKHGMMLEESASASYKAKLLDLGDRYLNAKHAKCYARMANADKSLEIMEEFVRRPLVEDTMNHFQCMWYEYECGNAYIQNEQYLHAHRVFQAILNHFNEFTTDQNDFYSYCLRRYMISDFNSIITFMDKMFNNKYVIKAMYMLDVIKEKLLTENKETELMKELDQMKIQDSVKEYTFNTQKELIESIDKDIYVFCLKIQSLTRCPLGQYICLKYFIMNNKPLRALKSLLILRDNKDQSFFLAEGHKMFVQYYNDSVSKMNKTFVDIIQEQYKELNVKTIEYKMKDTMTLVQYQLYCNRKFSNEKENSDLIKQVLALDKITLRQTPNYLINEMISLATLTTNLAFKNQFKTDLITIVKLNVDEKELKGNLTFLQEEENTTADTCLKKEQQVPIGKTEVSSG